MNLVTARKVIRQRASSSSGVLFVEHALGQMCRRGVDVPKVQRLLLRGEITEGPYVPIAFRTGTPHGALLVVLDHPPVHGLADVVEGGEQVLIQTGCWSASFGSLN